MARGRKPQDPEHGAMTPNERSARRRAILAEQAQTAIERPSEAHNLPGPALVAALQGQLAQIERDPVASRHQAAAVVAALVRKYRLPVAESEIEWDFSINEARLAQIAT
jgi:hypothetical protein